MNNKREELLLKMYDQMFNDINRHILVIWQSVGVLIGAFAIFSLTEKQIISLDIASSIILLLCAWLISHLYDAAYWYNRNLAIISNIEKQFLLESDLKEIHYYFGKHRPSNTMLTHLKIQYALAVGIGLIVLWYHFFNRVMPGFNFPFDSFDFNRSLPYLVVLISLGFLIYLKKQRDTSYQEFINKSPGKEIKSNDIQHGTGHGFSQKSSEGESECHVIAKSIDG
jgi:hypothetical protein